MREAQRNAVTLSCCLRAKRSEAIGPPGAAEGAPQVSLTAAAAATAAFAFAAWSADHQAVAAGQQATGGAFFPHNSFVCGLLDSVAPPPAFTQSVSFRLRAGKNGRLLA